MEKTKTNGHLKEMLIQLAVAVLPRVTEALVSFLERMLQEKGQAAQMNQAAKSNAVAVSAKESVKQPDGYISNPESGTK